MKTARVAVPLLALIAIVLLLISGPSVHLGWWTFVTGFKLLEWAAYAGLAAAGLGIIALIVPATRHGFSAWLTVSIIVGLVVAWVPWHWAQRARSVPAIHDISTNTANPPQFVGVLPLRKDAPNSPIYGGSSVAAQQHAAYPDIKPLHLNLPPAQVFQRALDAAKAMGWKMVAVVPAVGGIEATATTGWFGFKDDIVVRVRTEGSGSVVDVRSQSRVGRSDIGTNAARVRNYLRKLAGG